MNKINERMEESKLSLTHQTQLNDDVCKIIEGSQQRLATTINAEICMLHWNIGKLKKKMYFSISEPNMVNKYFEICRRF